MTSTGIERFDTGVDLAGLMAVLSQHMYSTPDVALRELVQNAHDSITRRRIIDPGTPPPSISVRTDQAAGTLEFWDNGSGLTEDEIHRLLATVGVGATRELREQGVSDDLIGLFGLGFLSAFVIAGEVVLTTTSCQKPEETWEYRSFDGFHYTVLPAPSREVGTTVVLRIKDSYRDLCSDAMARGIIERYCCLLFDPITINGSDPINLEAPWRSAGASDADRLDFAKRFERRFDPVAAMAVATDSDWLKGQLWIHGGSTYGNADNRRLSVYVRGMLLAQNDVDMLPRWAGFVSGVVESSILTPTASRETLQKDAHYAEAQMAIAEALATGLAALARNSPRTWQRILTRHGQSLLGAAITDDRLFELISNQVGIPTSQGERPVGALRVGRRIYVSLGAERGFEELLFIARGVPVARGDRYGVLPFLRRYAEKHDLELIEVGTDSGNAELFPAEEIDPAEQAWLQAELAAAGEVAIATRFDPQSLPVVVIPDREAELKQKIESDELEDSAGSGVLGLARLHTSGTPDRPPVRLYVNLSCPTVLRMLKVRHDNPAGAMRAVTFLRTLKTMMAASDRSRGGGVDITASLEEALAVMDGFLLETAPPLDEKDPL